MKVSLKLSTNLQFESESFIATFNKVVPSIKDKTYSEQIFRHNRTSFDHTSTRLMLWFSIFQKPRGKNSKKRDWRQSWYLFLAVTTDIIWLHIILVEVAKAIVSVWLLAGTGTAAAKTQLRRLWWQLKRKYGEVRKDNI